MKFYNCEKLKHYIKCEASRYGIDINSTYNTFFARILLHQISKNSGFPFLVVGSFSQLMYLGKMVRPVTDVDLIATAGQIEALDTLRKSLSESIEDLKFTLKDNMTLSRTGILGASVMANFGTIQHIIPIDIKVEKPIYYEIQNRKVPKVFSEDDEYFAYTASYEEHLAEKLCIVVEESSYPDLNSRMKDLYDIYKMHNGNYDFDKFSCYFERMIKDRGKICVDAISSEFLNFQYICNHLLMWDNMKKKYDFLDREATLDNTVSCVKSVLDDQMQKIKKGDNNGRSVQMGLVQKK